jgi:hypothetical protein
MAFMRSRVRLPSGPPNFPASVIGEGSAKSFAGLASLAVGALGAQFVCSNDAAGHQLLWHFTPVVLLTVASIAVGSSLFGWPHRQEPYST